MLQKAYGLFFISLSLCGLCISQPAYAASITPSHVYAQAERIYADVLSIKAHNKLTARIEHTDIKVQLRPRHVWQKTYEILVKLNLYHRNQYPGVAPGSIEPIKDLPPQLVYDQTQRILLEIRLIKNRLNITTPTPAAKHYRNKVPTDVYNLLSRASRELDIINSTGLTPSNVFGQVFRINSDIDLILYTLGVADQSIPPSKQADSLPKDAFKAGMALKQTINTLQRKLAIPVTDFSALENGHVTPSHVFALIGLITAELQEIKFALSLQHQRTPAAKFYQGKIPADVEQLLGWCNNKLMQVRSVQF
ncbi:MAG: hypothetical protein JKY87_04285 [Mariprofundus sp.]|nr:hypothetical protein [Mariprofundus sp.]